MGRIVHFEIPSDNPEKLTAFYKEIFGWTFQKWGDIEYWLATTGAQDKPGIDGAITRKNDSVPVTVNTIEVDDISKAMKDIPAHGGEVLSKEIMEIPDVGKFIYGKDPEGNIIGVLEGIKR